MSKTYGPFFFHKDFPQTQTYSSKDFMTGKQKSQSQIVHYILLHHPTRSRFDIDTYLLTLNYTPIEIESAWQTVLNPKPSLELDNSKLAAVERVLSKSILFVVSFAGLGLLGLFSFFAWLILTIEEEFPIFLQIPLIIQGSIAPPVILFRSIQAIARKRAKGWLGLFGVFVFVGTLLTWPAWSTTLPEPLPEYPGSIKIEDGETFPEALNYLQNKTASYEGFEIKKYRLFVTPDDKATIYAYYNSLAKENRRTGDVFAPRFNKDTMLTVVCFPIKHGRTIFSVKQTIAFAVLTRDNSTDVKTINQYFTNIPQGYNVLLLMEGFTTRLYH